MLDGIKILVERLNGCEDNMQGFEYLAQEVVRDYGDDVDPFTREEKAAVREALIKYRRKQFTARVLSKVSTDDQVWVAESMAESMAEGRLMPKKLVVNQAQMELARRLVK